MSEPVVSLSPPAVAAVKNIRAKEGLSDAHALRVAVVGGGCSGFSYQLDFDDVVHDDDQILEFDGVQVRVDPTSAQYLQGIQIDYVASLSGGGFKFINPNAKQTCGCGSSFSA
jgi:iron-sulfur cluster assembly accessory protein